MLFPTRCDGVHLRPDPGVAGAGTPPFERREFERDKDEVRSRILVWYAKGSPDLDEEDDGSINTYNPFSSSVQR